MKKMVTSIFLVVLMLVLSACNSGQANTERDAMEKKDQSYYFTENKSKTYSYRNFVKNFDGSFSNLLKQYDVPFYKETNEGARYTIISTDKQDVLVLFGDHDACSYKEIVYSKHAHEADLDQIAMGMTVREVMEVDPEGEYRFTYTSWSGYPHVSTHFVQKYCYMIEYDDIYVISISKFTL